MGWLNLPMCGMDFETTGVDPESDRIVSAAVVLRGGGRPTGRRSWLADPGIEIPAGATAVHGITTEYARAAGRPAAEVVEEVAASVTEAVAAGSPLVVMNAPFDLTMLDRECRRYGLVPLVDRCSPYVLDPRVLDKKVSRRRGSRTLTDLARHYVVPLYGAHSAEADALAACAVTYKIANRYRFLADTPLPRLHAHQAQWAADQQQGLRDYFTRTKGKEHQAAGVRLDWPMIPAPVATGSSL
ncbi:exonuclease domain-containing protein [Streptomyces canus]|uniref:exonuclease domain-containing protein n=1 Tax=Streptomyces canus TaxID=58343 RepID=UPI002E2594D9|nr:exonuclease domain-containing protein [Streptomyces canus]